jgi:hypothetical protein
MNPHPALQSQEEVNAGVRNDMNQLRGMLSDINEALRASARHPVAASTPGSAGFATAREGWNTASDIGHRAREVLPQGGEQRGQHGDGRQPASFAFAIPEPANDPHTTHPRDRREQYTPVLTRNQLDQRAAVTAENLLPALNAIADRELRTPEETAEGIPQ